MTSLSFFRQQFAFLSFGMLCALLSNFGQTFFIALYNEAIRTDFDLSFAELGSLYAGATLLSAVVYFFVGKFIDEWPLARFTLFVFSGLVIGCVLLGLTSNIYLFFVGLYLVRQFGQGLASHTGTTAIARAYEKNRGTAVAIGQLGFPIGESFMPALGLAIILLVGWQTSWLVYAVFIGFIALPILLFLTRYEPVLDPHSDEAVKSGDRSDVLRDPIFYLILPLYLSSPFLLTGMFFNQVALASERDWTLSILAAAFSFFALCKIISSLLAGQLVDRLSAKRVLPFTGIPLMVAFLILSFPGVVTNAGVSDHIIVFLYLGLCGITVGVTSPVSGSLWAELYGTRHLGAIRSMTGPIMILSTSLAPILFGLALDAGVTFVTIAKFGVLYILITSLLAFVTTRRKLNT